MIRGLLRRLGERWTWLRHTYPFQLAHGPLCERYEADSVRVGHVHLCRSCLALYVALAGVVAALFVWSPGANGVLIALAVTAAVVFPLSWPPLYRRFPRILRDALRGGAGVFGAITLFALLMGYWLPTMIGVVVGAGGLLVYSRVRRRQRAHMCDGCPELGAGGVCSGYAVQAQHIRRYEDAMAARVAPGIEAKLRARERSS